mmetsp:Transcript_8338/g.19081  ORF Transcript_8338/g.19081 Transcript_8338/m.19081 type:complete len:81 (-) Transcript_8338:1277-1519(-)
MLFRSLIFLNCTQTLSDHLYFYRECEIFNRLINVSRDPSRLRPRSLSKNLMSSTGMSSKSTFAFDSAAESATDACATTIS